MIKYDPVSGELIIFPEPAEFGLGTSITQLAFRIPKMTDNSMLHFIADLFTAADYSGVAVESVNSATLRTNMKVFDGTEWIAFPAEGVGDPYYEKKFMLTLRLVQPVTQYYIRYKWFIAGIDPATFPWFSAAYPALEINNVADNPPTA